VKFNGNCHSKAASLRPLGFASVGLLILLGTTGCGGGGGGRSAYTLAATQSCLRKAGFQTAPLPNRFLPGAGGNLRVRLDNPGTQLPGVKSPRFNIGSGDYVFLVFDKDPAAALETERRAVTLAVRFAKARGRPVTRRAVQDAVALDRNVFYYSSTGPLSASERASVGSCLR
jgi:hypothetical protein